MTPHIRGRLGDRLANLLRIALLYYVFSLEGLEDVPIIIQDRVQNAYLHSHTLPVDINLVRKIPLIITGHEGEVYIDEIPKFSSRNDDNNEHNNNNNNSGENGVNNSDENGGGAAGGPVGEFTGGNLGGLLGRNQQQQLMTLFS